MQINTYRQHPISLIQGIWKNLFLLLFPTLRALLALRFDIYTWISGAWFDILIIIAILTYAYLRCVSKTMQTKENEIVFIRGIFLIRKSKIKTDIITTVYFSNNPLYKIFGAVKVIIETNGGLSKSPEFSLTLSKKRAKEFEEFLQNNTVNSAKKTFSPKLHFLIFYSIQSTSTLSGILLLSALFSQGGAILGRQLREDFLITVNSVSRKFVLGIPPVLISVSVILLVGWTVGFLYNIIRYLKFKLTRQNDTLIIDKGIFVRQKYYVYTQKIISVIKKQSLLTKLLLISSVFICCDGYGKGKGESSVIFPAVNNSESDSMQKVMLPEFRFSKIKIKPKNAWLSYTCIPLILSAVILLFILVLNHSKIELLYLLRFVLIIALIPLIWQVIVRFIASKLCGIGIENGIVTISHVKRFSFYKVCLKKSSIVKVKVIKNPFSAITNRCKIKIYSKSEHTKSYKILGFYKSQADQIVKMLT